MGSVIWITGFSGSGKTTIARMLEARLAAAGVKAIALDGDVMRAVLGRERAFAREERLELAWIYARLCRALACQGFPVICATISMFHDVRAWNRANLPSYYEVYLRVPVEERAARDPKALYGAKGDMAHRMVGRDDPAEEPHAPDLVVENWGNMTADLAVDGIWRLLSKVKQ